MKNEFSISITVKTYDSIEELEPENRQIMEAALIASKNAYAPYSNFFVGAALLLDNGEIVSGNNQENAAYPSGICAERVAIFSAHALHPKAAIKKIAITAHSTQVAVDKPISPCGACRQVIAEYETLFGNNIEIIMSGQTGKIFRVNSIEDLLPFMFNSKALNN